ncbi:hypothetical protein A3D05_02020 [Candidatus Gottesmanbacteria bacterium RIFCSPHIGHO2_02_FULL_40_24]|uniref:tetrahydrofolate synthase n=1 Tax=Candidatus Gottesmanbacteria bacterium RIFCSPHIGHO2_01_FULL_40_15 TaxID=1798376 RepID=A0A1F5Z3P3_9BACT|nr:MAG: hypothetical protein A2777_04230 [Candidatus Gottesmanbacteria bacterium RIFCSPHIGHO2_01_FULL_40_15]OGG18632.1 MAG: hypothetical protein A3D05_02020 [Candidatus Gottesmanbacteria bacterium RIFCSPHIGHO2_02_FULL_40_24]OGG22822.1 MAG: hypothetical protein A3B48_05545 [Candidatus Gottesmanbacteria bacterium RIFCSPLOWO2_01_FULL_40_10]OGG24943.1 MAG: hypothetical protein A3E42_02825 [Candidatus Gottesmanbacteria bacterium RIFCSPHIGHO2_12_FULL_40_13]
MIKTYEEAVKYLEKFIPTADKRHPGELGIVRMRLLAALLDNPQNKFKTIHVAGTSGKGSTATILANILARKYRVGLHTSPHLERLNERIAISDNRKIFREVTNKEFVELTNEIKPKIEKMEKDLLAPSYFEIVTASAFNFFMKERVDVAVIEAGLGGKVDATNIINPVISIITNIGLDHTDVLGETVEEIAKDKAKIIKKGITLVTGVRQTRVVNIVKAESRKLRAKSLFLNKDFSVNIRKITEKGTYFDYAGEKNYKNLFIPLPGKHQAENATLAIRAAEVMGKYGFEADENSIRRTLKTVTIPGRMEIIREKPYVILDGAHNPDKIRALVNAFNDIWANRKATVVLAIKEGKNAFEMIYNLLPISQKIIITQYKIMTEQGEITSYNTGIIEEKIRKINKKIPIISITDTEKAVKSAIKKAERRDIILITGSLYLVGLVRPIFK